MSDEEEVEKSKTSKKTSIDEDDTLLQNIKRFIGGLTPSDLANQDLKSKVSNLMHEKFLETQKDSSFKGRHKDVFHSPERVNLSKKSEKKQR